MILFGGISGKAPPARGKVLTKFLRNLSNSEYRFRILNDPPCFELLVVIEMKSRHLPLRYSKIIGVRMTTYI